MVIELGQRPLWGCPEHYGWLATNVTRFRNAEVNVVAT